MDLFAYKHRPAQAHGHGANPDASGNAPVKPAELSREAVRWLLTVKMTGSLRAIPVMYPHILSQIASIWAYPRAADRYLNELLLTSRDQRQGFPPAVVTELLLLRDKNNQRLLPPVKQDVWSQALLR